MRVAILLAAGGSRRFGRPNKLLQPLGGRPVLCRALAVAVAAPVQRVILVVGADAARTVRAVRGYGHRLAIVRVGDWRAGLGASLRAAIAAMKPIEREAMVFLGDMPFVADDAGRRLAAAMRAGVKAARMTWNGRPGHPVLFRTPLVRSAGARGDDGLGRILADLPAAQHVLVAGARGAIVDIDRPADLRRARRRVAMEKKRARPV